GSAELADRGDALEVRFVPDGDVVLIPLPAIDYIHFVDAVRLEAGPDSRPALSLLITGRATGRRDLLAGVSASRELVYLELLERSWNFREIPLAAAPSPTGDRILIGSDEQTVLMFASGAAGIP